MKLCIPVTSPEGLESLIAPDLPDAEHLLFFDTDTRSCRTLALSAEEAGAASDLRIDAVLCAAINRRTLLTLTRQGIEVYCTQVPNVAQAVALYEDGKLQVAAIAPGGCGGHGHGHEHRAGGCCSGHAEHAGDHHCAATGGGCGVQGKAHAHAGGSCCGGEARAPDAHVKKSPGELVRIAVSSQNRKTVTEHAGKCRKFWIFDVRNGELVGKSLVELAIDQSFHAANRAEAHPLDGIDVLLTAGIGSGLQQRLRQRGIEALLTTQTDPDQAVVAYLAGDTLARQDKNPAPCHATDART